MGCHGGVPVDVQDTIHRKRENTSCKLIWRSFLSFFKRPVLVDDPFHYVFLLRASAIVNGAENAFDGGGGSDNVVNATRFLGG